MARGPRRRWLRALDVTMAVVLLGGVGTFWSRHQHQVDHDQEARQVAEWALDRGVDRIAWPAELRRSVPALLDAGVEPVLLGPDEPALQYAANYTAVVVRHAADPPPDLVVARQPFGDLVAYEIRLYRALQTPLEVGDTVGEELSRPYRYAPLRPSPSVVPGASFNRALSLPPGRYRVEVEAFAPTAASRASFSVALTPVNGESDIRGGIAERVVRAPFQATFDIPPGSSDAVTFGVVTFALGSRPSTPVLLHAWRITRVAE